MSEIFDDEGISMSQWIVEYANELQYDAVGLWGIIPYFKLYFLLSGDVLTDYTRLAIYEICNRGAKPVTGSGLFKPSPYDWILQEQYGLTKEEIADNIIKEWQENKCIDPDVDGIWFYIPNEYCFNPDYYQVNKERMCLAMWITEFVKEKSKRIISLSEIIIELQNNFDLSQYQLDYFVCMIIERLYYQGLRPVMKTISPLSDQYQWNLQTQYGLSANSVGFKIVKKWQEDRKNSLDIESIYFYTLDKNCFIPKDYQEEVDDWKSVIF